MIGEGFTLYNMLQIDNTLFDNIMLYEKIDKDVMLTEIFKRCGSLPCIDFNPDLYKIFVENFFKKYYNMFAKLYDSMYFDYNPLENLKRERNLNSKNVREESRNGDRNNTSESHGTDSNVTESEQTISAMDSNIYQPDRKTDSDSTTNSDVNNSGSEKYNENTDGTDVLEEIESEHGTIGVITNQDMIEKERRVVRYDFYREVAGMYENELCVSIY